MAIITGITFEKSIAVSARFPLYDRTVLRVTEFTEIATGVVSYVVIALFTLVAILFTG